MFFMKEKRGDTREGLKILIYCVLLAVFVIIVGKILMDMLKKGLS